MDGVQAGCGGGGAVSKVVIDTEKLDALVIKFPEMVDKAIRATAFDVEANAKSMAAVDTGAMRASIFTKTHSSNGFEDAGGEALGHNNDAEINDPTPATPPLMTAYVAPGVNYAYFQEFGTGKMAAHPFMTPAVEKADEAFEKYMKQIFGEI
jgi:HK97 gp10 family phage protein